MDGAKSSKEMTEPTQNRSETALMEQGLPVSATNARVEAELAVPLRRRRCAGRC